MKKTTRITKPTKYHGYILVPRTDGAMDLLDPQTGTWAVFTTQRHAKWSATVVTNITKRFQSNGVLSTRMCSVLEQLASEGETT